MSRPRSLPGKPPPAAAPFPAERALELLDILPVGVAVLGADRRLALANPAYHDSLGLPPGSLKLGLELTELLRMSARRGVFGPGDPEVQTEQALRLDRSRPGRLRRRQFDGRTFDLYNVPLADGGNLACAVEITALVAAREEADVLAARLSLGLSAARTGLAVFGPDRRLLLRNPRFAELLGLPADLAAAGQGFAELLAVLRGRDDYAGADGEAFLAAQLVLDRTRPSGLRRLRDNGQVIDLASDPLPDGGWIMTVTDISPLARAEDDARRRAATLDGLVASIPQGICVYGPDRRVTMFNRAYSEIMRGAPVEIGERLDEVIRRRAAAGEYGMGDPGPVFEQQMAFDISRPQMRRRRRPNGTMIDVRTVPLPDGGHVSVVADITPLMQAEIEVSRRAAEMDMMVANIHHGIIMFDHDGRVVAHNRIASELLGHPTGLVVRGRHAHELIDHMLARGEFGCGPDAEAAAAALRTRDRAARHRHERVTMAGRTIEVTADPAPGGRHVETYNDVTAIRAGESELRRAKEAAEAANQAKSRFLATMSHELRTPLNAVIGFSDSLMRESGDTMDADRVSEFAQEINQAGRQLLALVNNILDVARIEAGRFELSGDLIDLAQLVRVTVRQANPAAQAAEVAMESEVGEGETLLRGDERRLRQVMSHLLSNAVKFTPAGGTVTVSTALAEDGDLLLRVADTGIGIAEADLERVFEPFTQADGTLARRFEGSGLGLYVSRALVHAHGGRLYLRRRPEGGVIAEVRMPRDRLVSPGAAR